MKETRLVARTTEEVKKIIQSAAEVEGLSLSEFIINAALIKANSVFEFQQMVRRFVN
jgi:uncharacterized protein (DUF1778 family)